MERSLKYVLRKSSHKELLQRRFPWTVLHWITQPPTTKYWRICWNQNRRRSLRDHEETRICCPTKKAFMSASQKDLYPNMFWHRAKEGSEKQAAARSVSCMSTWKFSPSFGVSFYSLCSMVGLWSTWPGDNSLLHGPPLQPLPGHGDGEGKGLGCFPGRGGIGKHWRVRNAWPLPNSWLIHPPHFGV